MAYAKSLMTSYTRNIRAGKYRKIGIKPKPKFTYQQFKKQLDGLVNNEPAFDALQHKYPKYAKRHGKELDKSLAKFHEEDKNKPHRHKFGRQQQPNHHINPDDGPDFT